MKFHDIKRKFESLFIKMMEYDDGIAHAYIAAMQFFNLPPSIQEEVLEELKQDSRSVDSRY